MSIETAVNGFGRIGMVYTRVAVDTPELNVRVINVGGNADVHDAAVRLEFDQIHRDFDGHNVTEGDGCIFVDDEPISIRSFTDPRLAQWAEFGDRLTVIESTGQYLTRKEVQGHLESGAKRVVVTAPARDDSIPTIVRGVNDTEAAYEKVEDIVAVSSCSTNCIAPIVKVISDEFNLRFGIAKIPHAFTNSQRPLDGRGKSISSRRGLASMLPASTGSGTEVHRLFPTLDFFNAESMRVNIQNGSVAMLTLGFLGHISAQNVVDVLKEASETSHQGIIGMSKNGMFLEKVLGKSVSSLIDPKQITALPSGELTLVNMQAWFDNEWGYGNRVAEVTERVGALI